jgi:2-dehydropantoate 2-reductase
MRFAVLGAGAIGAYVGACIARGGGDVVLIARGRHLDAMRAHGVRVISPLGDFQTEVEATDEIRAIRDADVVFLGLKAYALPAIAAELGADLRRDAAVIAAQNGIPWWYFQHHGGQFDGLRLECVDPGGIVSGAISPERTVGCVIYCSTEIVEPGVIRHIAGTRFAIGEPDGSESARCREISERFNAGGLKCPVAANLREQIWLKMVGNVPFNTVTALTGATLGELGDLDEMVALLRATMQECADVASRLGISLPMSGRRRLEAGIAIGDHRTSMLQDLESGKPLETACLTGAVVELADRLNMAVPHARALHACIRLLEHVRDSAERTA